MLGLDRGRRDGDSVYLRGESEYERYGLKLTEADTPGLGHLGLRTRSAARWSARVAALRAAGIDGAWLDGDQATARRSASTIPTGISSSCTGRPSASVPSPASRRCRATAWRGGAGAGVDVRRLDHVNLLAADVEPAAAFARDAARLLAATTRCARTTAR